MNVGLVAIVLIFSIPILGIITDHFQKQTKLKRDIIKDQIKLEQLKQENYLLETEKLKLELNKLENEILQDVPNIEKIK